MKIALAQQNYHIGNFDSNRDKIIAGIREAKAAGADLVVFSELCICGYPPRDFLEFHDFIEACYRSLDQIREEADTIGVLVGSPARNPRKEGKDLFNAAFLLYEKEIKAEIHKTLLPNYDVFDEYRYFEPAYDWQVVAFKGKKLAVTICEDIWNMGDNPLYRITPMEKLAAFGPDVMINLSASPYNYAQDIVRNSIVKAHTIRYQLPMLYCNTVGSQTEIVFDGGSLVYDIQGRQVKEMKYFEEDFAVFDLDELSRVEGKKTAIKEEPYYYSAAEVGKGEDILAYLTNEKNIEEIHQALVLGIRDYFFKMGFKKAILGSSGGIDSAVTLALAVEALGKENVTAVLMPSPYSTGHSVSDAETLSRNLDNPYHILPIRDIYESFLSTLKPVFEDRPFSVAEENIQSRTRGNLLMGLANKFGYILLNTSNKSELATGYGTLYGDMAGGLGVLGDLYKVQVYALAKRINRDRALIPESILTKAPSAELRPNQKDSDSLPEYDILDRVLYNYIELRKGPREIISEGYDPVLVNRVLKLVNTNEYKRNQFCPIIRVSAKAFGVGRRVPIVGKYLS
ncbi:MAG: NAD+ synthase [Chitinophagaceae bacterium]|nr:NAD+ synthase [Chitinophagaceae bacterium]MBN8668962.1 NAD+ synthase [Chitinophagales bacterium]